MLPLNLSRPAGRPLRVLCLGAHSDDVEIGCGGATLQLVAAGAEVHWAVFSGNPERAREAERSARLFLGSGFASRLHCFTFRDGFFPSELVGVKERCEQLARAIQPEVVFSHFRDDRHQDHRVLSDLAWNTFRRHVVLEYEIPKWDGDLGRPNFYLPLSAAEARRKVRFLMQVFATQRAKDWFTESTFLGLMRLRGIECRADSGLAEAFHARKLAWDIGGQARRSGSGRPRRRS
jgi:LmbE family N-acetylglucosaminyl deacetylase